MTELTDAQKRALDKKHMIKYHEQFHSKNVPIEQCRQPECQTEVIKAQDAEE